MVQMWRHSAGFCSLALLPTGRTWPSCSTSLCLNFLNCRMGLIKRTYFHKVSVGVYETVCRKGLRHMSTIATSGLLKSPGLCESP